MAEIVIYNGSDEPHQTQVQFFVPKQSTYELGGIFRLMSIGKLAFKQWYKNENSKSPVL